MIHGTTVRHLLRATSLLAALTGCAHRTSGTAPGTAPGAAPRPAVASTARAATAGPAEPVAATAYASTLEARRLALVDRGLRLAPADVGYYMDVQEARLRQLGGPALRLTRRGTSVVLELPGALNFEVGRANLSPGARAALSGVARVLVDYRLTIISIDGHTDDSGDPAANRTLSEQRASAVAKALIADGVDAERLVVVGRGSERPVGDNATEVGREANRRVVLRIDALSP